MPSVTQTGMRATACRLLLVNLRKRFFMFRSQKKPAAQTPAGAG
jgi:hypothetical protein